MNVVELNKGMLLAGRLSEVHVKNLQTYPFLVFDGLLDTAAIDYDITPATKQQNTSFITYNLFFKKDRPENFEELKDTLIKMVKTLFWKDMKVNVFIGDKKDGQEQRSAA